MTSDPFAHLPHLRDRLTPADRSGVRMTPEVLAFFDERERRLGRPDDWRLTDRQREASRHELLGGRSGADDLWVFGYGSLMWDPGIHFAEVRLADLDGFQRRFSNRLTMARGTPESPALMLSLEPCAGRCRGLAFRIPARIADAESEILWRREMICGGYTPAMLPLSTPQGAVTALVFTANPQYPEYAGELPLHETARVIADASGPLGSNRSYLEQLAEQLAILAIADDYVEQLLGHVRDMNRSHPTTSLT